MARIIRVGETVRITDVGIFAAFVKKGDVATVNDVDLEGNYIGVWLENENWNYDQYVCVRSHDGDDCDNRSITFLHDSQKLIDKPKK